MNERDLHFSRYAVRLFDELKPLMHQWSQAQKEYHFARMQQIEGEIQNILAQRAYDLAYHFIESAYSLEGCQYRSKLGGEIRQSLVKMLPDMITWPEQR